MTERYPTLDELLPLFKEADAASTISMLLHEILRPLHTIRGYAAILISEMGKHDFKLSENLSDWLLNRIVEKENTITQVCSRMSSSDYTEENLVILRHEIRNPIAQIKGCSDFMGKLIEQEGMQLPEIFVRGINTIYESACYMETLCSAIHVSQSDNEA